MLKPEKNYDFRKELMQVHKPNRRDLSLAPNKNEFVLTDGLCIVLPENANIVVTTAAKDFADYLDVSMNIAAVVSKKALDDWQCIKLCINEDIEEASGYMGYRITVSTDGILIEGWHDKGIAQALYALEDLMNLRKAPFIPFGKIKRKAVFERRFTHSPMGYLLYTEEVLSLIAHYGMDCILVWARDLERDYKEEHYDLRLICERAEKYGIDVYLESYIPHEKHPDDAGAEAYYDKLYGTLFSKCPKLKGLSLSGEAQRFYSHDPHAQSPAERAVKDNLPKTKPNPGWWPCNDYPAWAALIKKCASKYRPDVDITFSTYNWGYVDARHRLELLRNMPKDITIKPAWDIFGHLDFGDVKAHVADYSLSYIGPSEYFTSEAELLKEKGHRFYGNCQCSGRTWDFGVIPYEPMPYQWIKRYEKIVEAHYKWGMCGVIENIHYGFHPSLIPDLEKQMFFTNGKDPKAIVRDLLIRDYGEENLETVDKAMRLWSKAITHYVPANEDQYGAFRVGPSYPLWTHSGAPYDGKYPAHKYAIFGNRIFTAKYNPSYGRPSNKNEFVSLPGIRIHHRLKAYALLRDMLYEGIKTLETIENPSDALQKLINLGWFMYRTTLTVMNSINLFILKSKLDIVETNDEAKKLIDGMEEILQNEKTNVESTIPLVQVDSRLGWEPSMEYTTDEAALQWKLKQLDIELNYRIPHYKRKSEL